MSMKYTWMKAAFPFPLETGDSCEPGMDLRDYFAIRFAIAIWTEHTNFITPEQVCERAYVFADLMMKEREIETEDSTYEQSLGTIPP